MFLLCYMFLFLLSSFQTPQEYFFIIIYIHKTTKLFNLKEQQKKISAHKRINVLHFKMQWILCPIKNSSSLLFLFIFNTLQFLFNTRLVILCTVIFYIICCCLRKCPVALACRFPVSSIINFNQYMYIRGAQEIQKKWFLLLKWRLFLLLNETEKKENKK